MPLTLTVGQTRDVPLLLTTAAATVGAITQHAPLVETTRTQSSDTIAPQEIASLPLNGRNYLDLALLAPNVTRTNTRSAERFAETSAVPGTGITIAGQRNIGNTFIVDGLSANDDAADLAGTYFGQEVIREFQVITSGGAAEFGRASAGTINIVTQSGTNESVAGCMGSSATMRWMRVTRWRLPQTRCHSRPVRDHAGRAAREGSHVRVRQRRADAAGQDRIRHDHARQRRRRQRGAGRVRLWRAARRAGGFRPGTTPPMSLPRWIIRRQGHASRAAVQPLRREQRQRAQRRRLERCQPRHARWTTSIRPRRSACCRRSPRRSSTRSRAQCDPSRLDAPSTMSSAPRSRRRAWPSFGTSTSSPTGRDLDVVQVADTLTVQHGAHLIKAGVDLLYNRVHDPLSGRAAGSATPLRRWPTSSAGSTSSISRHSATRRCASRIRTSGFSCRTNGGRAPRLTVDRRAPLRPAVAAGSRSRSMRQRVTAPGRGLGAGRRPDRRTRQRRHLFRSHSAARDRRTRCSATASTIRPRCSRSASRARRCSRACWPAFPGDAADGGHQHRSRTSRTGAPVSSAFRSSGRSAARPRLTAGYTWLRGQEIIMSRNINVPTLTRRRPRPSAIANLGRPNPADSATSASTNRSVTPGTTG